MINDSRPFGSILDSPLLRAFASFLLATEGDSGMGRGVVFSLDGSKPDRGRRVVRDSCMNRDLR